MKIGETVKKETLFIAGFVFIGSCLMEAVFLAIGAWNYTVILGNLLSGSVAVLNFLFLGMTVERALTMEDEDRKRALKTSQSLRFLFFIVSVSLGVALPCFHTVAAIVPLFLPRIAIAVRPYFDRKNAEDDTSENTENDNRD